MKSLRNCLLQTSVPCSRRAKDHLLATIFLFLLSSVHWNLFEHIVCSNIMARLDEHRHLSVKQRSFRKWQSCETQLNTVIDDRAKILDNQGQVDTF